MTSQSRKSRRTTASRITRGWRGISLAALAAAGGPGLAQDPIPLPSAVVDTSSAEWKTWPTTQPVTVARPDLPATPPKSEQSKSIETRSTGSRPLVPPAPAPSAIPVDRTPVPTLPPIESLYTSGYQVQQPDKPQPMPYPVSVEPNKNDVFRLDRDAVLEARVKSYIGREDLKFPELPDIAKGKVFTARSYPSSKVELEPGFVVHKRLYFEEKNGERYGWELGAAQPFVSAAYFYKDFVFLPYNFASNLCERYDTSAGKCLPGSPVPYLLYPPDFSWTGAAAQVGVVTGLTFIFP